MKFLINYLVWHISIFVFITIIGEAILGLYLQQQQAPSTFWAAFLTHFCKQSSLILERIVSLDFQEFIVIVWAKWLLDSKPHYIFLLLVSILAYFRFKSKSLERPLLVRQPEKSMASHQQDIRVNTKRELEKLKPQIEKFFDQQQKNRQAGRKDDKENEDGIEFMEKEDEIFSI